MGFFDRFSSDKGKSDKAVPASTVKKPVPAAKSDAAKKKAFAAVPSSKKTEVKTSPAAAKETKDVVAVPTLKDTTLEAYRILLRPVVTEKTSDQQAGGRYTFEVATRASKMDVRNAVHKVYGIRPTAVNIINLSGKVVRYGRYYGRTTDRKKAIITLPTGKTIDPYRSA